MRLALENPLSSHASPLVLFLRNLDHRTTPTPSRACSALPCEPARPFPQGFFTSSFFYVFVSCFHVGECPVDPMRMRFDSIMKLDQKSKVKVRNLNLDHRATCSFLLPSRFHSATPRILFCSRLLVCCIASFSRGIAQGAKAHRQAFPLLRFF